MIRFTRLVFAVPFLFLGVAFLMLGTVIMGRHRAQEFADALKKLGLK